MLLPPYAAGMASATVIALATMAVSAQEYPNKPVRILTSAVGSNSDFHARLLAQGLAGPLGQQVIVDNRGGGVASTQRCAKSTPDGYTLLVDSNSVWLTSLLQKTLYDPVRDFSPVSLLSRSPYVLVVHPSLPAGSVKELVSLAKAKPGQLNFASGSPGTAGHLAAELFKSIAGIKLVGVSYASNSQEIGDVVSGQVQLTFWSGSRAIPLVKAGKVTIVGHYQRGAVRVVSRSSYDGSLGRARLRIGYSLSVGLAPAKTPEAIIHRLNQETVRFLNQPEVKRKLLDSGLEAAGSSPEELAATIKSSMARMDKVIKAAGIRVE